MADPKLNIKVTADVDKARSGLKSVAKTMLGFASAAVLVKKSLDGFRGAIKFEEALSEISTITDDLRVSTKEFRRELSALGSEFGSSGASQAKAFYQIISAGVTDSVKAQQLLVDANKLAIGGLTDVEGAVDLLTSAVNAFGQESLTSTRASDILFTTVRLGKTTITELQASMGQLLPTAKTLGISFEEASASVAQLTTKGVNTARSVTQMNALFTSITKGAKDIDGLSFELNQKIQKAFTIENLNAKGLDNFLIEIDRLADGSAQTISKILGGNVRSFKAFASLAADDFVGLSDKIKQTKEDSDETQKAFEKMEKTLSFQLKKTLFTISNAFQEFLSPAIKLAGSTLKDFNDGAFKAKAFIKRLAIEALILGGVFAAFNVSTVLIALSALRLKLIAVATSAKLARISLTLFKGVATLGAFIVFDQLVVTFIKLKEEGYTFTEIIALGFKKLELLVLKFTLSSKKLFTSLASGFGIRYDFGSGQILAEINKIEAEISKSDARILKRKIDASSGEKKDALKTQAEILAEKEAKRKAEFDKEEAALKARQAKKVNDERLLVSSIEKIKNDSDKRIEVAKRLLTDAAFENKTESEITSLKSKIFNELIPVSKQAALELQKIYQTTGRDEALAAIDSIKNSTLSLAPTIKENKKEARDFNTLLKETKINTPAEIGLTAVNSFAGGLSNAFVQVASGTKKASDAFRDFAKSFLSQIARMILQAAILKSIQSSFGIKSGGDIPSVDTENAEGGLISGSGSGTSDSVRANLSTGEFVSDSRTVSAYGANFFRKLKAGARKASSGFTPSFSGSPNFASGGFVGGQASGSEFVGGESLNRFEIVNSGGGKKISSVNETRDAKGAIIQIILEDVDNNGPVSRSLSSTFGMKRGVS